MFLTIHVSGEPFTCLSFLWSQFLRARPPGVVHAFPGRDFRIFENLEKSENFDFRQKRSKTPRFRGIFDRVCQKTKFSDFSRFSKIQKLRPGKACTAPRGRAHKN